MAKAKEPEKRGRGRPSLFTEDRRRKILDALRLGNYRVVSARYAGVSDATFYGWLERSRDERARGMTTDYTRFLEDVEVAEAQAETMLVADLRAQARTNPTATLGMLRVRFRDRWSEAPTRLEVTGKDGGPVALSPVLAGIPDAVLDERIKELERKVQE